MGRSFPLMSRPILSEGHWRRDLPDSPTDGGAACGSVTGTAASLGSLVPCRRHSGPPLASRAQGALPLWDGGGGHSGLDGAGLPLGLLGTGRHG